MGEQIGAAGFHKHLEASVVGPKDEHLVVATTSAVQSIPSQLVKPMIRTRNVSVIQKVANFVDGSEYATKNLAEDFLNENMRGGQTELTLNGMIIMSAEETRAALKVPELGWNTKADGTVDAWVERVPTNVFSFKMHLPSIAPWIKVTTKARVSELMTKHQYQAPAGCNIPGNSTFRLNGKPSDANLATNIRTHEYLHVSDFKQGFNSFIIPWDTKLEQAKAASTKFNGATIVAAKAALFASMGGTPEQIATAFDNEMERRLRVTHANRTTATGGGPTGTNFVANATCTESSADFM
jgi:hypothetical protein